MYINFKLLEEKGYDYKILCLLQACKQNKTDSLGSFIKNNWLEEDLDFLEDGGLISYIKGKKKDTKFDKVRISKKGQKLLDDLETPEINEDDLRIYEWLEKTFSTDDRVVGNRKKCKLYIALFRVHSGIDRNKLAFLISSYLKSDKMEYTIKLEYLFFKPANVFSVKFDIEQSKLYKYYLENEEYFNKKFEEV